MKSLISIWFDLGNLLVDIRGVGILKRELGYSDSDTTFLQVWTKACQVYESGKMDFEEFADTIGNNRSEKKSDLAKVAFLNRVGDVKKGAVDLLDTLKGRCHLAVVSNTNSAHITYLQSRTKLLSYFDSHFYSFEMGVMKPDPRYFLDVLAALEKDPSEVLYFDDEKANITSALSLGIESYVVDSPGAAAKQLKNKGYFPGVL